jgi:hypothetical protein
MSGCNSVSGASAEVAQRSRISGGTPARRRLPGVRWVEDLPPYSSSPAAAGESVGALPTGSGRVTGGGALAVCPDLSSVSLADGTQVSFIAMSSLIPALTD